MEHQLGRVAYVAPAAFSGLSVRNQFVCKTIRRSLRPTVPNRRQSITASLPTEKAPSQFVENETEQPGKMSVEERVFRELQERGIDLEELLEPAKVIKLERKIEEKQAELLALTDAAEIQKVEQEIRKLQLDSATEKRLVMQAWMKNLFTLQGVLGITIGGILAYGGNYTEQHNIMSSLLFHGEDVPMVARVLGFWLIWMFTIPSLRARKPLKTEKAALNVAFLALPLANILAPFATKDPFYIWIMDMILLAGCYGYYFGLKMDPSDAPKLKGVMKWLDWSSWR